MISSEFNLIESIKNRVNRAQKPSGKIYGIGDDCAVYRISEKGFGLFSTDISIEHVHFDLGYTSLFDAGYRSMSANISDIYAMGGKPVLALVSIGLPTFFNTEMVDELYDGILACAIKHETFIAGGDTSKSGELILNISIYGEAASPVFRKGAVPGEWVYITGNTGLSKLGLDYLKNNSDRSLFPKSIEKHLRPEPRGDLIEMILNEYKPSAMIDVSDGLIQDLGHICEMSGCGFELDERKIPADHELVRFCDQNKVKISDYTFYSGEEYELVFTAKNQIADNNLITCIGNVTRSGYSLNSDGILTSIGLKGFDHFK